MARDSDSDSDGGGFCGCFGKKKGRKTPRVATPERKAPELVPEKEKLEEEVEEQKEDIIDETTIAIPEEEGLVVEDGPHCADVTVIELEPPELEADDMLQLEDKDDIPQERADDDDDDDDERGSEIGSNSSSEDLALGDEDLPALTSGEAAVVEQLVEEVPDNNFDEPAIAAIEGEPLEAETNEFEEAVGHTVSELVQEATAIEDANITDFDDTPANAAEDSDVEANVDDAGTDNVAIEDVELEEAEEDDISSVDSSVKDVAIEDVVAPVPIVEDTVKLEKTVPKALEVEPEVPKALEDTTPQVVTEETIIEETETILPPQVAPVREDTTDAASQVSTMVGKSLEAAGKFIQEYAINPIANMTTSTLSKPEPASRELQKPVFDRSVEGMAPGYLNDFSPEALGFLPPIQQFMNAVPYVFGGDQYVLYDSGYAASEVQILNSSMTCNPYPLKGLPSNFSAPVAPIQRPEYLMVDSGYPNTSFQYEAVDPVSSGRLMYSGPTGTQQPANTQYQMIQGVTAESQSYLQTFPQGIPSAGPVNPSYGNTVNVNAFPRRESAETFGQAFIPKVESHKMDSKVVSEAPLYTTSGSLEETVLSGVPRNNVPLYDGSKLSGPVSHVDTNISKNLNIPSKKVVETKLPPSNVGGKQGHSGDASALGRQANDALEKAMGGSSLGDMLIPTADGSYKVIRGEEFSSFCQETGYDGPCFRVMRDDPQSVETALLVAQIHCGLNLQHPQNLISPVEAVH